MVWYGKSSQEYPVNAGVPQCSILGPTLFLLYINDLPDVTCDVAIYGEKTTLYSKCDQASDLWQKLELLEKNNWFRFTGIKTLAVLMWKWICLFLREKNLLRCWGWLSFLNWTGAVKLSLLQALIRSMKFLYLEAALYLYKSTICPLMEYFVKGAKFDSRICPETVIILFLPKFSFLHGVCSGFSQMRPPCLSKAWQNIYQCNPCLHYLWLVPGVGNEQWRQSFKLSLNTFRHRTFM